MATRKNITAAAAVLIALGYCSLCHCKRRHVKIPPITLKDVFISVKTTRHNQNTRLPVILDTWFQLAKEQIWFFTDIDNPQLQYETNGHMVNTNCPATHQIVDLCCKTGFEYDYFMKSEKRWFCHFDDDNYVNVPRLLSMLKKYDYNRFWYLGKTANREVVIRKIGKKTFKFWYGTGGAGYCLSRGMALRLLPVIGNGKFKIFCHKFHMPDDVNMGFMIHLLGSNLTEIPRFHSHCEKIWEIGTNRLKNQITLSFDLGSVEPNVPTVPGFHPVIDPTRFLSLHCFLFPHCLFCSEFRAFLASVEKIHKQYQAYVKGKLLKSKQRQHTERKGKHTKAPVTRNATAAQSRLVRVHSRFKSRKT